MKYLSMKWAENIAQNVFLGAHSASRQCNRNRYFPTLLNCIHGYSKEMLVCELSDDKTNEYIEDSL